MNREPETRNLPPEMMVEVLLKAILEQLKELNDTVEMMRT